MTETEAPLTPEEWATAKAIRAVLVAKGRLKEELHLRLHKGQCGEKCCPNWPARRVGILATVNLGDGLVVSREYGGAV